MVLTFHDTRTDLPSVDFRFNSSHHFGKKETYLNHLQAIQAWDGVSLEVDMLQKFRDCRVVAK
jgi:hypothetical protein